ncbi:MAG: hypothetical protein JW700_01940 [Candidatus Aenigmarchaeota archaeon]|nr:hypothetical protein [Candidatus Aenigmarchaeota archaeon]
MPKRIHDYPQDEKLELLILTNSPCTPSDILKLEKIPIKPDTLETMKKKMDSLCKKGRAKKRKISRANVYWHMNIEDYKKKMLTKALDKLVKLRGSR